MEKDDCSDGFAHATGIAIRITFLKNGPLIHKQTPSLHKSWFIGICDCKSQDVTS
jgi:hypothetical protein